jgi:hypothetical protein
MMDEVTICPNCGEANPADLPYCRNCQWRLRSLDSEWGTDQGTVGDVGPQSASSDKATDASVPDWLRQSPNQTPYEKSDDEAIASQLRDRLAAEGAEDLLTTASSPRESEDLLAGLTRAEAPDDEPVPDWVARIMGISENDDLAQIQAEEPQGQFGYGQGSQFAETQQMEAAPGPLGAGPEFGTQAPRQDLGQPGQPNIPVSQADSGAGTREGDDIYEWLRQLDANNVAPPTPMSGKNVPATTDVPTWVGRMMGVSAEAAVDDGESNSSLPDWLKTTAPPDEVSLPSPSALAPEPPVVSDLPPVPTMGAQVQPAAEPVRIKTTGEVPPTLAETEGDSLDVDAVFAAMDMPQWSVSQGFAESAGVAETPAAAQDNEPIAPADLPSWVQAMRPLESAVAPPELRPAGSPRETGGPLLGLQGVLPAIPGAFPPSGRPKPHAMKLEVSEQHRSQALLLEELLDAETRPLPLQGRAPTGGPRLLRWLIAAVLLAALGIGLGYTSSSFRFPTGVPTETNAAIQVVENLPADATVLAVFDYEPATAGEMEVAAASLMDHLLLLKHPRLALISTSPTGSVLAERFVSKTLQERTYARGVQYADLGYLPGGLAGVQLFAQAPVDALPYGAATDRVWESPVLLGTTALSDFSAIIVLTDSHETGAVWIEQTTGRRGATPMIIIASAQAGPMLLPYYDSRQVQGLLFGINAAAAAENANGGRPGLVRRYWNAYNLGLYAAALLIALGAAWQIVGARGRRRAEAA